jgi:hypothetical protein
MDRHRSPRRAELGFTSSTVFTTGLAFKQHSGTEIEISERRSRDEMESYFLWKLILTSRNRALTTLTSTSLWFTTFILITARHIH